mmetsp:Transcript_63852/g.138817  ORF Transcript_63852/g.138817 Transcript_63852/m.138817 type:complete len:95 (+) Transcript_63852:203-487(+)
MYKYSGLKMCATAFGGAKCRSIHTGTVTATAQDAKERKKNMKGASTVTMPGCFGSNVAFAKVQTHVSAVRGLIILSTTNVIATIIGSATSMLGK